MLIHPEIVLTLADRFDDLNQDILEMGAWTRVVVGSALDQPQVVANATRVVVHPSYQAPWFEHDLALIWLDRPVDGPVMALNETPLGDAWLGLSMDIAGFGITDLQHPVLDHIQRQGTTRLEAFDDNFVWLFANDGTSTCWDDVGGPGMRYAGDQPVAVSLAQLHGPDCHGPAGQIRVDPYIPWIRDAIAPATITTVALEPPRLACDPARPSDGGVERACAVTVADTDPIAEVVWTWGDGQVDAGTDTSRTHVYDGPGAWAATVCVTTEHRDRPFATCFEPVETSLEPEGAADGCGRAHPGGRPWGLAVVVALIARRPRRSG